MKKKEKTIKELKEIATELSKSEQKQTKGGVFVHDIIPD